MTVMTRQVGLEVMLQTCIWEILNSDTDLVTSYPEIYSLFSSVTEGRYQDRTPFMLCLL
jgi:hypothetical protein